MIIFELLSTTFSWASFVESAGVVGKIGLIEPKHFLTKLCLTSQISETVF